MPTFSEKIRIFLSQTCVNWFKRIGILGWVRFRILRFAYKIFWSNSPRNGEWDFILSWLKPLRQWQFVRILDVGCTESLLIYELNHRGYDMTGIDQRPYQEEFKLKYKNNPIIRDIIFIQQDIIDKSKNSCFNYDYIIAVSTIEHIGLGAYGDKKQENGDRLAIKNIHIILKDNGYFIITVPNKHLGTDTGRGYSYQDFEKLISGLFRIVHFTERSNQICAVLVKS